MYIHLYSGLKIRCDRTIWTPNGPELGRSEKITIPQWLLPNNIMEQLIDVTNRPQNSQRVTTPPPL